MFVNMSLTKLLEMYCPNTTSDAGTMGKNFTR